MRTLLQKFRYRVTHTSKFPKGDLIAFLLNLASRGFEPAHIIDVGANQTKWAAKARRIFPACTFTLIEPQVELVPQLKKFCSRTPGSRWITAGAGAEPGELPFNVCADTVSSSFAFSEQTAREKNLNIRSVPIVTLDDVVAEEAGRIPDLVKIDTEGFEYEVMKGAQTLIGKTELFLLEAPFFRPRPGGCTFLELLAIMADYGYEPYDFTTFQKRSYDGAIGNTEIAFARRQGLLRAYHGWSAPSSQAVQPVTAKRHPESGDPSQRPAA